MDVNLNKLSAKTWIAMIFIWVTVISSGLLFIFIFKRDLFISLDLGKLALLSSSITTPFWLLNCALSLLADDKIFRHAITLEVDFLHLAIASAVFTFPVFYIPFTVRFFFHISLLATVITIISLEFALALLYIREAYLNKRNQSKRKQNQSA